MIYRVRHTTRYAYGSTVDLASHLLHLKPRELPGQKVLAAEIIAEPAASRLREALDHFGNHATWLFVDEPHSVFEVTGDATVDVGFAVPPAAAATLPWEAVAALARAGGPDGWQAAEFTFGSPMVRVEPAAGAYAAASFPPGRPVLAGLLELNARIRREFTYRSGVTDLSTPVAEVLRRREGVCQDFSHVMISALRALGLPARYVSGYLQSGQDGMDHEAAHAWGELYIAGIGWIGFDPANRCCPDDRYIRLGSGLDAQDAAPIRGISRGSGSEILSVTVAVQTQEQ